LLVDDDRWYDQENHYQHALEDNGIPYDYWEVNDDWPWDSPPLDILQRYPIVVWFTSYDWYQPLTADEETRLSTYLDGDGRLFFSSQDYLYRSGVTPFGQGYLGVLSYTEDMTTTVAVGERGSLVGDGLGPYDLAYPFHNYSDALTPTLTADIGFRGHHGLPVGLAHAAPAYRTVFFAFPFEALDSAPAKRVMQRITGWLSWLGTSELTADRNVVASGGTMTYTLSLNNDGWETVTGQLSNTLPSEISYVPDTLSPPTAVYEPTARRFSWDGTIPAGETLMVSYQVDVDPLPEGTVVTNVASIGYEEHQIAFDRWARTWVGIADLFGSTMEVDRVTARPGDSLFYTVVLRNAGFAAASPASLVNTIPEYTTYIPGSLSVSGGGVGGEDGGVVTWTGSIDVGISVTITYGVTVDAHPAGFTVTNRATVYDDYGNPLELTAYTLVPQYKYYLPLVSRGPKKAPHKH
jgi:uncharacterized repeat protein (TIGR01451 family)